MRSILMVLWWVSKVLGKEAGTSGEWTLIVSMSGDGVVHEIVQGLAAANNGSMGVPLAVLPCGSSNGLSMSFYGRLWSTSHHIRFRVSVRQYCGWYASIIDYCTYLF